MSRPRLAGSFDPAPGAWRPENRKAGAKVVKSTVHLNMCFRENLLPIAGGRQRTVSGGKKPEDPRQSMRQAGHSLHALWPDDRERLDLRINQIQGSSGRVKASDRVGRWPAGRQGQWLSSCVVVPGKEWTRKQPDQDAK